MCACLIFFSRVHAQTFGGLSGVVVDPADRVIRSATVTLRSGDREVARTLTDDSGRFSFPISNAGLFELRVEAEGFARETIRLRNISGALRIQMRVAEVRETLKVEESLVSASASENADVVRLGSAQLHNFAAINGDVVVALARTIGPGGNAYVIVDGAEAADNRIPISQIAEVRMNNDPYSAQYARPGKGRIEIITKSGSPKYHGSLSAGLQNSIFDARNAFALARPQQSQQQIEADLSGPITWIPKTTFAAYFSRIQAALEPSVYAIDASGPVIENAHESQSSTYFSAQATHRIRDDAFTLRFTDFHWRDDGEGVGGFVLPEAGTNGNTHSQQLQGTYREIVNARTLNDVSIRIRRDESKVRSVIPRVASIVVIDAITKGGAQNDTYNTQSQIDFNDVLSWSQGKHVIKAGVNIPTLGRFGVSDYSNQQGTFYFSSLADYTARKPFSFSQQSGDGHVSLAGALAGAFVQDEFKLRPNLSIAAGVRYDVQNYFSEHHDFAPRLSVAWGGGKKETTVVRAGSGIFYTPLPFSAIQNSLLLDGAHLRQLQVLNPLYPNPTITAAILPTDLARFAANFRAPYTIQYSAGIERQINKSMSLSSVYAGARGIDLFRSRDVNAPLPPLFLTRPNPSIGQFRQYESSGNSRRQEWRTTVNGEFSCFFSGMFIYQISRARNDTDGIAFFPANNWNPIGEWARASNDMLQFFYVFGTFNLAKYAKLGTIFTAGSGHPYSITSGHDDLHDGLANARPAGIERNTRETSATASLDLRLWREFAIPKEGITVLGAIDAFNLTNRVNYTVFAGALTSPLFGQPIAAAPARRIQLTVTVRF